jgi:hypothetical protein
MMAMATVEYPACQNSGKKNLCHYGTKPSGLFIKSYKLSEISNGCYAIENIDTNPPTSVSPRAWQGNKTGRNK